MIHILCAQRIKEKQRTKSAFWSSASTIKRVYLLIGLLSITATTSL